MPGRPNRGEVLLLPLLDALIPPFLFIFSSSSSWLSFLPIQATLSLLSSPPLTKRAFQRERELPPGRSSSPEDSTRRASAAGRSPRPPARPPAGPSNGKSRLLRSSLISHRRSIDRSIPRARSSHRRSLGGSGIAAAYGVRDGVVWQGRVDGARLVVELGGRRKKGRDFYAFFW